MIKDLTIAEIKSMKKKLEAKISFEMQAFEIQTGVEIESVDFVRFPPTIGEADSPIMLVELEIKL